MKPDERKLADTKGRFLRVVKNGRELTDVDWISGRLLLSTRRLVLVGNDGKLTIPLSKLTILARRFDANQNISKVSEYLSLGIDDDVVLVTACDLEPFELKIYGALLDQQVFIIRHPAIVGGVVQNTEWERARLKTERDAVVVATVNGKFVEIRLDDIGAVTTQERFITEEQRLVLEVEHSEADGTSVVTYLSGDEPLVVVLESLFRKGEDNSKTGVDLNQTEQQVLMALYSGLSPFEIPEFLGIDIDAVEALFERLVELEIVDEIRIRREVGLNARGRSIASTISSEQ